MIQRNFKGTIYGVEISGLDHPLDHVTCQRQYSLKYKGFTNRLAVNEELIYDKHFEEILFSEVLRFRETVEKRIEEMTPRVQLGEAYDLSQPAVRSYKGDDGKMHLYHTTATTSTSAYKYVDSTRPPPAPKPTKKELDVIAQLKADVEAWLAPAREIMYQ